MDKQTNSEAKDSGAIRAAVSVEQRSAEVAGASLRKIQAQIKDNTDSAVKAIRDLKEQNAELVEALRTLGQVVNDTLAAGDARVLIAPDIRVALRNASITAHELLAKVGA